MDPNKLPKTIQGDPNLSQVTQKRIAHRSLTVTVRPRRPTWFFPGKTSQFVFRIGPIPAGLRC
jgi:hypothetical protein